MLELTRADVEHRLFALFDDVDAWRHADLASAFTDDAVFTLCFSRQEREEGRLTQVEGGEAIGDFFRSAFASLAQTHHAISNVTVLIDGARAAATIHLRAYHQGKGAVADLFEESLGVAALRFRTVGGKALIERFDYTILIVLGTTDVFTQIK